MGREDSENVAIAFALVIGAGASTAVGASVVFFPALVQLASRKTLAGALGLSAGVMTYVSFVEIFQKSVIAFEDAEFDEDKAYLYATLCFFGGVVSMVFLNLVVHKLLGHKHNSPSGSSTQKKSQFSSTQDMVSREEPDEKIEQNETGNAPEVEALPCCSHDPVGQLENVHTMAQAIGADANAGRGEEKEEITAPEPNEPVVDEGTSASVCPCCATDPAGQLENVHTMAQAIGRTTEEEVKQEIVQGGDDEANPQPSQIEPELHSAGAAAMHTSTAEEAREAERIRLSKEEATRLARMSLKTAIAIGLHNFPEGLATFVAALNDPAVGAVLAIAIAIHNIPEGLCVAMPVYYATGNRCRAFMWALLSGISEPVAALLGWAVLANSFSDLLYGVLFGMVSGMMVIISVRELLPTAHRYDPEDSVVTNMFILGMLIMAVSLVLFVI